MNLSTEAFNHFNNYIHHISVSNNIDLLTDEAIDYYKLLYVESGTWHIYINNSEYIFNGPKIICLNENDKIRVSENSEFFSIVFFKPNVINNRFSFDKCNNSDFIKKMSVSETQDMFFLELFKHDKSNDSKILDISMITSSSISKNIYELNNILTGQQTSFWPCRSRAILLEILFYLTDIIDSESFVSTINLPCNFSKLSVEVIYYLQSTYNKKISVTDIAKKFSTNRTTLLSDFKKSTGFSITNYLLQIRLKMACSLLKDTQLSISEICERTGFSDVSYFSKTFKKELNCPPKEYRNKVII